MLFGLWRVCFPPVLVRTARRLPVEALGERGVVVSLTGYPRDGAPGPGGEREGEGAQNLNGLWSLEGVLSSRPCS